MINYAINFSDAFKSKFLENFQSHSLIDIVLAFGLSLALGIVIYIVYKKCFRGVLYSKNFGISLILISLITTLIILAISSNVILSLGMVGALSIVRFRAAIKEPMDIAFLFWAISVGIVNGAGIFLVSIVGSLLITIIALAMSSYKAKDFPYVLVLGLSTPYSEEKIQAILRARCSKYSIKSKTITKNGADMTVEIRVKNENTSIVNELERLEYVRSAALISFNGDYAA